MCVSILALVIRHAKRMRRIYVQSYVACLAITCVSTLSEKRHDFRMGEKERVTEHKMCVFIFCTTFA